MKSAKALILFICIFHVLGCGTTTKATISHNFSKTRHKNIIIAKSNSRAFSDHIVSNFLGAGLSVIDRQNTDAMLKEAELTQSGTVNPETAKQIGKLTGADALLILEWYGGLNPLAKLKMVDAENGAVLMTGHMKQTSGDAMSPEEMAEAIVKKIKSQLGN
jgi:hypothetical protein